MTQLGTRMWHKPSLQEHARRVLDDLSSATRTTVRLGILEAGAVSYIEKRPDTPVPTSFAPRSLPAHATAMGKALLAFAPAETVDEVSTTAWSSTRRSRSWRHPPFAAPSRSPG